jgi:cytoskeletal protein RodZ
LPPFGDKIKKAREGRGITLEDVALTTKIGTRFLRALEEEHFGQLPGGIFNRGFVRAYARCVGLDEDQTIADYLIASGEVQPKKAEVAEPIQAPVPRVPVPSVVARKEVLAEKVDQQPEDGGASNFPWAIALSVVVVAVLGLTAWHLVSRGSTGSAGTSSVSSIRKATPSDSQEGAPSGSAVPAANPASNSSSGPASFFVLVKASEESWISIKTDDKPAVEVTLEASEQQSIEAHNKVEVKVGNLAGVDFWFNGKRLTFQGGEGEVRTVTFDSTGLRPQVPRPDSADAPVTPP